jgi:predicted DNA-binding transcriptional regulator AlpA
MRNLLTPKAQEIFCMNSRDCEAVQDNRVLSFKQWCELNGISRSTGQRLISAGKGPRLIQLSEKRIGVTVAENRRWQASRVIETAA